MPRNSNLTRQGTCTNGTIQFKGYSCFLYRSMNCTQGEYEMDKLTMSIEEAAKVLGVGRNFCYELAKTGQLPTIRLGSRRLVVPRIALEKMLETADVQPRESDAE